MPDLLLDDQTCCYSPLDSYNLFRKSGEGFLFASADGRDCYGACWNLGVGFKNDLQKGIKRLVKREEFLLFWCDLFDEA